MSRGYRLLGGANVCRVQDRGILAGVPTQSHDLRAQDILPAPGTSSSSSDPQPYADRLGQAAYWCQQLISAPCYPQYPWQSTDERTVLVARIEKPRKDFRELVIHVSGSRCLLTLVQRELMYLAPGHPVVDRLVVRSLRMSLHSIP